MGIFDLFRKLAFFKDRDTQGMTAEDLDFARWIQAHREWRQRLSDHIAGRSAEPLEPETVCRDDCCALGQWIHGNGSRYYGDLPLFQHLRQHHAHFHQSAGSVIRSFRTQGAGAANALLHNDFDRSSLQVVSDLRSLAAKISA